MERIPLIPERDIRYMKTWFREVENKLRVRIDKNTKRPQRDDFALFSFAADIPKATVLGPDITPGSLFGTHVVLGSVGAFAPRTGSQERVYNISTTEDVPAGVHFAHRDYKTGLWFVLTPTKETTPPSGSRNIVSMEFTPTTPDTSVAPNAADPVLDWANATVKGVSGDITPDVANDQVQYNSGSYLLIGEVHARHDGDLNTSGTFYPSGHPYEGKYKRSGLDFYFEVEDGVGGWTRLKTAYIYPGPSEFHQTATLTQLLDVPATRNVRLRVGNRSTDSADATVTVFHAEWFSELVG